MECVLYTKRPKFAHTRSDRREQAQGTAIDSRVYCRTLHFCTSAQPFSDIFLYLFLTDTSQRGATLSQFLSIWKPERDKIPINLTWPSAHSATNNAVERYRSSFPSTQLQVHRLYLVDIGSCYHTMFN